MMAAAELDRQAQRMQAALSPVLTVGPDFLAGRRDADEMAHTMVDAVQAFMAAEQARQQAGTQPEEAVASPTPHRSAQQLQAALSEIYGCGSGYLAARCDAACVARTITQIMDEFGEPAANR